MLKLGRVACVLGLTVSLGCGENLLDDAKKNAENQDGNRNTDGTRTADVPPPSDVMGTTPVSDLGNSEAKELCEWQSKLLEETIAKLSPDQICTIAGLSAPDPQQCAMIAAQCGQAMAQGGAPPPANQGEDCSNAQLPPEAAKCAATVQEIEDCMTATVQAFIDQVSKATCDQAGSDPAEPAEPDACKALDAKCPGLFDAGDMGMGMGGPGGPIGPGGDGDMTPPDGATCPDGTPTDDPASCPPPDQQCPDPNGCPDQPPPDGEFPCADGSSVAASVVCDGNPDCKDGSDEDPQLCSGGDQPPPPPQGN